MSHKPTKGAPLAQSRVQAARSGPRVPLFAVAVGALVAALMAAVVGVVVFGSDDQGGGTLAAGDQAFGPVTATGAALPDYDPDAAEDPAVGEPAPALEGETPSGEPVTIDPADGPMVVAFLAHWCAHCQAEVPRLVALADGTDEIEGVPFAAVLTSSVADRESFPPGEWLTGEGWPAPAMVDTEFEEGQFPVGHTAYGLAGFPYLVAVDGDGIVVARSSGELGDEGLRDFFATAADAA